MSKLNVGLNLNDSAIGWSVMDDNFRPVRKNGKTLTGVYKFEPGVSAEDRRLHRSSRRRTNRVKTRIKLLNSLMEEHLKKEDPTFLDRLARSNRAVSDPKRNFEHSFLFPDGSESDYKENYPTIYHLRWALMTEDRKFSVKEVYLALHHLIKYRGNFLFSMPVSEFNLSKVDFQGELDKLFDGLLTQNLLSNKINDLVQAEHILLGNETKKNDKKKLLNALFVQKQETIEQRKTQKALVTLLVGGKTDLNALVNLGSDEKHRVSLEDATSSEDLEAFMAICNEEQQAVIKQLMEVWNVIQLNRILPGGESVSQMMIKRYNTHRDQLKVLKRFWKQQKPELRKELQQIYADYLDNVSTAQYSVKETMYRAYRKALGDDDSADAQLIMNWIDDDNFLPKLRVVENAIIPNQAHHLELDRIIDNQAKYYPWLAEIKGKLDAIMSFKIPYYVGPLMEKREGNERSKFSWMVRKEKGKIYPWNFDEKVDKIATAENFIDRMIGKDTYLLTEKVLPKQSILYENYSVLNEINNVRINGKHLSRDLKVKVYDLFKNHSRVTVKMMVDIYKEQNHLINTPYVEGLSNKAAFTTNLNSYRAMKKIFGEKVDDKQYQKDIDTIIEYLAVFEERQIFVEKVKQEFDWISEEELQKVKALHGNPQFQGWGRLSRKLLLDIRDAQYKNVMGLLWNTNKNFASIISDDSINEKIEKISDNILQNYSLEDVLNNAYASPQTRKTIKKMSVLMDDLDRVLKQNPETISIISGRYSGQNNYTYATLKALAKNSEFSTNKELSDELQDVFKNHKDLISNPKTVLYFTQGGKDMYTGEKLDLKKLNAYQIDYIISPRILKDETLNNEVLTNKPVNLNGVVNVSREVGKNVMSGSNKTIRNYWDSLLDKGFITKSKYQNLITDPDNITPYQVNSIIHRDLVETGHVVKLAAKILNERYPDTQIIETRTNLLNQLKDHFDFIQNPMINDYHFGFDAFLAAFVGRYMYLRYPKLRGYFVYGEYQLLASKDFPKKMMHLNFLRDLFNEDLDDVVEPYSDQLVINREKAIASLNKVYNYHYMLVTKELVAYENGQLFNETKYKANYHSDVQRTLIPMKRDKDPKLYGGYTSEKAGYLLLVKIGLPKQEPFFRLLKMPIRFIDDLKRMNKSAAEKRTLEIVQAQLSKKERNNAKVVAPYIKMNQLFIDGKVKFSARTSAYMCNETQLCLSHKSLKILAKKDATDEELVAVYDDVLTQVNKYFALYDMRKFRQKLNDGRTLFEKLSNNREDKINKRRVLNEVFIGLQANTSSRMIPALKISSGLGSMQNNAGIKLSKDAVIVKQSPTGYFAKRIKLEDFS